MLSSKIRWLSGVTQTTRPALSTTHEVFNQSLPFVNVDILMSDKPLVSALHSMTGKKGVIDMAYLESYAKKSGSESMMEVAELAEKNKPTLRQFDNNGRRIDVVDFHPAYHALMNHALTHGVSGYGFSVAKPGSQLMRAALIYMENQIDPGHCCPLVMTAASIPLLQKVAPNSAWIQSFVTKIFAHNYDPNNIPIEEKSGVTLGMSMTEKQGGSDVRANTTIAKPIDPNHTGIGSGYLLTGHKWFTSAPMCDGFLTLAKTPNVETPSCFLVPRWQPDGKRNVGLKFMRLKDKLGDRSNASSEVEYDEAYGMLVGEEGKGVKTIIEMVQATRLDCTLGSAGHARRALQVAINHTTTRSAFGKRLIEQPLMSNVLTDLCVEAEAMTLMAMRMSAAYDAYYNGDITMVDCESIEEAKELFRIGVTISKYFVTKRLPHFTYECMEQLGGNSFVEDFPMARLYRHAPLNSIWEGSGNVIALDILRGMKSIPVLLKEINRANGMDSRLDNYVVNLTKHINNLVKENDLLGNTAQRSARNLVDRLAIALQASILLRFGHAEVAKAYITSRIAHDDTMGVNYGGGIIFDDKIAEKFIERNRPVFMPLSVATAAVNNKNYSLLYSK